MANLDIGPETPETYALAQSCDRGIQSPADLMRRAMLLAKKLEADLVKLRADHEMEMQSIVMIRCTQHVRVPKLNGLAHGDAECGACIAEDLEAWKRIGKAFWRAFHTLDLDDRQQQEEEALYAAAELIEKEKKKAVTPDVTREAQQGGAQ